MRLLYYILFLILFGPFSGIKVTPSGLRLARSVDLVGLINAISIVVCKGEVVD